MFYSKNTFLPPHSYSSLGGKAGCPPSSVRLVPRGSCLFPPLSQITPQRGGQAARLALAASQALEKQIRPYLPESPGCLGPLRGEAMATGACGEAHIWSLENVGSGRWPGKKWPCSEGELRWIINSTVSLPFQLAVSVTAGLTV